jgi:hypothetical protein
MNSAMVISFKDKENTKRFNLSLLKIEVLDVELFRESTEAVFIEEGYRRRLKKNDFMGDCSEGALCL